MRSVFGGLLAALALAGGVAAAPAWAQQATIKLAYLADPSHEAVMWALRQGKVKSDKVKVEATPLDISALIQATAARTYDIIQTAAMAVPRAREAALYLEGRWHGLQFLESDLAGRSPIERLDVALLQRLVLGPLFGIDDPRTSQRLDFVGGIRGTGELERRVAGGAAACAFALHPTSMEELLAIADAGGIMLPKSTWFEPKLRDGMFCHGFTG